MPALQEPLVYLHARDSVGVVRHHVVKVTPAVPAVFPSGPTTVHVAQ